MNIKKLLIAAILLTGGFAANAQQLNPLVKAVLDAYDANLKDDPKDYTTYYQRSIEYYQLSQYDRALSDINNAIEYTPSSMADLLAKEYSFKADILTEMKRPEDALKAVENALIIDPKSFSDIYKKGNLLILCNRPQEAYQTYKSMLTMKSRSQAAFFGMAMACADMGNSAEAQELLVQAREVDPTNPLTYCRLGDVYKRLKDYPTAVVSYISAVTLGGDLDRPVDNMLDIAKKHYADYKTGIDYAEKQSQSSAVVNYVNAAISEKVNASTDALNALQRVVNSSEGNNEATYTQLARLALATGNLDRALNYIDEAIKIEASADRYLTKSAIELARGANASALLEATKAFNVDPTVDALVAIAKANIASGDSKAALEALNEAALTEADNADVRLLRAYVFKKMLNNEAQAINDLKMVALNPSTSLPDVAMRSIALAKTGYKDQAEQLMTAALSNAESCNDLIAAAIYYAQTGNTSERDRLIKMAKSAGFDNNYILQLDKTPMLSLEYTDF